MADIRYQVLMNGRVVCTAGVEGLGGVLVASLTWAKRKRRIDDNVPIEADILEPHWLHVGGIDPAMDDHVEWCDEPLQPGDEITFRILGPGVADEPADRFKYRSS